MKIEIDQKVFDKFPSYKRRIIVAQDINNKGEDDERFNFLTLQQNNIRKNHFLCQTPELEPPIKKWMDIFKDMGLDPFITNPSVYALIRMCVEEKKIPFINKIVAICNYISLKYLTPCGADDLHLIEGDCQLKIALGTEIFIPINSMKIQNPEKNEIIYTDQKRVLCRRWVWHQNEFTKITEDTTAAIINLDLMSPAGEEVDHAATREMKELILKFCGGSIQDFLLHTEQDSVEIQINQSDEEIIDATGVKDLLKIPETSPHPDKETIGVWHLTDLVERGVIEDVVVFDDFLAILDREEKITIYQGFDPTSPNLHIGHLVSLRVLRWFQLRGHKVIFLIGDATALVGDPSGQSMKRDMLTPEIVKTNMMTYQAQASKILDFERGENPVEFKRNSEWLLRLTLGDLLQLFAKITVQRLLERDMFRERMKKGDPLFYVETIYPLLQGYDSVAMEVDAELGGSDQLFNMLVGRDLVKEYLCKTKYVLTTPLLAGFDGRKMSKTYGNTVDLIASPYEKFLKIMEVKDQLIEIYFSLLTNLSHDWIKKIRPLVVRKPKDLKQRLAYEIVAMLDGHEAAKKAYKEYVRVTTQAQLPKEIEGVHYEKDGNVQSINVIELLHGVKPSVFKSKAEIRRLIQQKGLTVNGQLVEGIDKEISIGRADEIIFRIGKKKFYMITFK